MGFRVLQVADYIGNRIKMIFGTAAVCPSRAFVESPSFTAGAFAGSANIPNLRNALPIF
jgi:hypothetical protein